METFNTVSAAVTAIRMRIWDQAKAKDCAYKCKVDGACTKYTFKVGRCAWVVYFDNYGRATTERA